MSTCMMLSAHYLHTTIGRGNGAMLFYLIYLLLLTPLIVIICFAYSRKICRNLCNDLKLMKSYFYNRTQRVQIDNGCLTLLILFVVFIKAQF